MTVPRTLLTAYIIFLGLRNKVHVGFFQYKSSKGDYLIELCFTNLDTDIWHAACIKSPNGVVSNDILKLELIKALDYIGIDQSFCKKKFSKDLSSILE